MTVDELQVLITANTDNLRKEINKTNSLVAGLQKQATKMGNSMFSSIFKGTLATSILTKSMQLVTQSLDSAVTRLDALNNFPRVMSNLGISSEDAEASMKRLSDALIGLPTSLDDATLSVQRFTSANGNVKASTEMYLALNNAILAGGAGMEVQKSAMEQLSQAYAKGKPDMMEWRTAMMAMPAQMKQVAIAMGYANTDQLGEALRNGQVSMNEFMTKIVELNQNGANGFKSFEEQARNSTGGVATSIINVKTAITRGLAEIMNAIGQSNIAGFFQGIARAINNAVPYVVAFVKVVATAVNFISGLFGKTNATTKSVNKATSSLGSLGGAGTSTSKGLDNATGSAKKLNKELGKLAGFDEMNVLQENTNTSGGGGGGTDAGAGGVGDLSGIDLSGFDSALDTTNSKVDELYNKMLDKLKWFTEDMNFEPLIDSFYNLADAIGYLVNGVGGLLGDFIANYLKPVATYVVNDALPRFFNATAEAIKGIEFDTISNALNHLWDALAPFTETVGNGLLWLYEKVLLPLAGIVINDIVPGFLHLLAGAVDMVNLAISKAMPVIQWLWDNFLLPIVSWTGGVIGDVLSAIGDALSWIASNEVAVAILEGLAIVLGSIAGVIALVNVAIGVWNVVGAIGTAVTSAFGVALNVLLSPITLIIGAIALLVAGIILLVKHWDDVKEVAKKVWDKIKEIWGVVADWFKEHIIEPIKRLFEPLIDFYINIFTTIIDNVKIIFNNLVIIAKAVWDGIKNVFGAIGDWFKNAWNNVVTVVKAVFTPILDFYKGIWDGIKNIFSSVGTFFKDVFTKAFTTVKNVFNPIVSFFSGIFDKIKNVFKKIGTTVGNVVSSAFKGVVNAVLRTIENVLNTPIRAVNGLIGVINKLPGVNLGKLNTFDLPRLARGGIIDRPTLAQIGEQGKEVVMPLERNTGWITQLADTLDERMVNGNGQPIQLVVKIGEDTILNKVIDGINKKSFETNEGVFNL